MPKVVFPYTKEGEKNAKAAAKMHGGKYMSDKKDKGKGIGVMIAVGPVKKKSKKKAPVRRTKKKA
tara:strand:+ start:629 stop:823 length:195 start_codon:yes stop_codon:yes gene_type:complete